MLAECTLHMLSFITGWNEAFALLLVWFSLLITMVNTVVATTHQNSTCSMLTSAKLSVGYLVVGITRKLDKEPLLHYSSIYTSISWSILQQYLPALMSMLLPHVLLLRPPCHIHVPWHHTLNLYCTCAHYMYTMRNSYLLISSLTLTLI